MPEDLNPLEASLAAVSPSPSRLDRDALMYAAGRAVAPRRRIWPAAAAGLALLALGLGARLATVEPRVVEKLVYIQEPALESMPYPGFVYEADASRYDELLRRTSPLGDLPPQRAPSVVAQGWSAPLRPTLEHDLDLPAGSLRDVGPRPVSPPNP